MGAATARDLVTRRHLTHVNVLAAPRTAREFARWHNRLQELAAGTRLGIPVTVSSDPRHSFTDNPGRRAAVRAVLAVARDARARGPARRATGRGARRRRPPRVPRRRHPDRPAPAGRPAHRAPLGPRRRDLRGGRRPRRPAGSGVRPRTAGHRRRRAGTGPGRSLRSGLGVHDDEALPRRRPTARRRGPALPLRPGAGLPGRVLRDAPAAVPRPDRRRDRQVMPYYGMPVGLVRNGEPVEEVGFGFSRQVVTASCARSWGSTGSSAPTGVWSPTPRSSASPSRRAPGAWNT